MSKVIVLTVVQVECCKDQGSQLPVGPRTGVVSTLVSAYRSLRLLNGAQNVADVYLTLREEALKVGKHLQFKMQALLLDGGCSARTAATPRRQTLHVNVRR